MNRAGSTLQYNLVRVMLEQLALGQGAGFLSNLGGGNGTLVAGWAADPSWRVLKAHHLPAGSKSLLATGSMRLCYIYRDIRDVAASYRRVWRTQPQVLLAELDRAVAFYETVTSLTGPILLQRYETVVADPVAATRELAHFLGLPLAEAEAAQVAAACSPEAMQAVTARLSRQLSRERWLRRPASWARRGLRRLGIWRRPLVNQTGVKRAMDRDTLLHPDHLATTVTRGTHHLEASELAEISRRYEAWLRATGYVTQEGDP